MNIHTLHIEHVMLLAVYTLLTLANSLIYRSMKGTHWFSLYNVFALLGAIAVVLRGQISDFTSIVVGNLFVVLCYFCLFLSLSALFGRKLQQTYLQGFLVMAGAITMLQYGSLHPNTRLRLIAYSIVLGIQQIHIAWFLFQSPARMLRRASTTMAVVMLGLALANIVRILGVVLQGAPADYLRAGTFLAFIVVVNTCLQCGVMVAYIWLTAALLRQELEVLASTDPLTGLLNRRAIEIAAESSLLKCRLAHADLTVMTLDLDGFKAINDTYGHSCGDATLIAVAQCLRKRLRADEPLARTGGDEFALLMPRTSLSMAAEIAESLRRAIEELEIVCPHPGEGAAERVLHAKITASFGLAKAESTSDWDQLMTLCDKALYAVKRAGGNQVSTMPYPDDPDPSASSTLLAI